MPDVDPLKALAQGVADSLRLAPRSLVVDHLRHITAELAVRRVGDEWLGAEIRDEPGTSGSQSVVSGAAYGRVQGAVLDVVSGGLDRDLGHAALVEILRDIAGALEQGDLARDPYGPRDSRLIDAGAAAAADSAGTSAATLPRDDAATFDPSRRLADKQAARDKDDDDLASGRLSTIELHRRNSFASGLDLANATVRVPNPAAWDYPASTGEAVEQMAAWIDDLLGLAEEHDAPAELTGHARATRDALASWAAQLPSDRDGKVPDHG